MALHVAGELTTSFPDGAWLCELAPVGADAVATALAGVLAVTQRQAATVTPALVDYLRAKQLLIVLDSCEHVAAAAAELAGALLRGCPRVRVLATSREPLGADGEHVLPVAPLETRDAVALFVARATAASPSFGLTPANAVDVTEVCRRLDGLPLALELVAPKVRSLSAREIVTRLDRRMAFVRTAGRIREQRHRTLRAVVDWSYQLLDAQQRRVFDRLSVFAGSFTVAAAQRIAGGDLDTEEVAEIVGGLVDRSMLGAQTDDPPTRYTMLDTLRHYGRERLKAAGWATSTRLDHARYHVELAEAAFIGLTGPDPGRWSRTIERHLDDLRAAHNWAIHHEPGLAMRLTAALYWYVEAGSFLEVSLWAEQAATAAPSHPLRPLVLGVAAWGASKRGDLSGAVDLARRGLTATGADDPLRRYPLFILGEALARVDPQAAIVAIDAALATSRETRNRFVEAVALVSAASLRGRHGDPLAALPLFGQVIDHWQRAGNWTQQWITLRNVIDLFARLGADEPAAILCGALGASRTATPLFGADADEFASTASALETRMGEREYRRCLARGAAMTDDDAVILAATEINRSTPPAMCAGSDQ
ncbi:MAG: ATP-binding protein [Pseudonocardiaceae bacterium]